MYKGWKIAYKCSACDYPHTLATQRRSKRNRMCVNCGKLVWEGLFKKVSYFVVEKQVSNLFFTYVSESLKIYRPDLVYASWGNYSLIHGLTGKQIKTITREEDTQDLGGLEAEAIREEYYKEVLKDFYHDNS